MSCGRVMRALTQRRGRKRALAADPQLPLPIGGPRRVAQPDYARLGIDDPEGRN